MTVTRRGGGWPNAIMIGQRARQVPPAARLLAAVQKIANRDAAPGEIQRLQAEARTYGELALYQRLSSEAAPARSWPYTITLPVFNRPHALAQVLESLRTSFQRLRQKAPAYAASWGLIVAAEPGLPCVQQALGVDFMPVRVLVNRELRGLRANLFQGLDFAFQNGSRFNLHLEDDVVLSPSAFDLVYWYERTFGHRPRDYFSYCLFADSVSFPLDASGLRYLKTFEGYGWCVFAEMWHEHFRNNWFVDDGEPAGWDWQMRRVCERSGMRSLAPCASRSNHIGRHGTYSSPEVYDRRFANVKMYEADEVHSMDLCE